MFDVVIGFVADIGAFFRPHTGDIALALVASILVIVGNDINLYIKKQFAGANFFVRTTAFVLVCTFGYGAITVFLTRILKTQLMSLSTEVLAVVVVGSFFGLGMFAERKRQI